MSSMEENIRTLVGLGLSRTQARICLALAVTGKSTIREISEASSVNRSDTYRAVVELEKKGLIEKIVSAPTRYTLLSLHDILSILVGRRETKSLELQDRAASLLEEYEKKLTEQYQVCESEFTLVPKKEAVIQRIKQSIQNAEISVCSITSEMRFSSAIVEFEDVYQKALQKSVKIRIATNRHFPQGDAIKIMRKLMENPNFEVKYFDEPSQVVASVVDDKVASVVLSATAHLPDASVIWSSNPCFVILAKSYFENQWSKASY